MGRKIPREFVPLDLQLPRDPAIRTAGYVAELLYVRGLLYLKSSDKDGLIPRYDLPVVGVGLPNTGKAAAALVKAGLWVENADGWVCRSWLKWNLSQAEQADDKERKRQAAILTNHRRYHSDEPNGDCPFCAEGVS